MDVVSLDMPRQSTSEQSAGQTAREARRIHMSRDELVERLARAVRVDGTIEPLHGLHLYRHSTPLERIHSLAAPSLCVVAQGSKEFLLGESRYRYDPLHYLLITVDVPSAGQVIEASKERPFLGLRLDLTAALVNSVMVDVDHAMPTSPTDRRAIAISAMDANLLDAAVRLVRLLDAPGEARALTPLITREIVYRLLMSEQGGRLWRMARAGGYTPDIVRAIDVLRQQFDQPLRIERLARELGMSVSGFHHHFKAVTALSPLQFQKRLRLLEARRLMLDQNLDAASAALRVGYRDASHFNREYKSLFGAPPMRDVQRLREVGVEDAE